MLICCLRSALSLQVLKQGVTFADGTSYHFVGSSAAQLRERTAVMLRCSSPDEAMGLLNSWGNFGAIGNNVAKLYKRIGLMFSAGAGTAKLGNRHTHTRKGVCGHAWLSLCDELSSPSWMSAL
jgi:hypothetical protein